MRRSLAWANLIHAPTRTAVGVLAITFAVVLVLLQLGFLGSVDAAAILLYDQLDFDLVLVSSQYLVVNQAGVFPSARLYEAQSVPGVAGVRPLYFSYQLWRNPDADSTQRPLRTIMVIGFRPEDRVFRLPAVQQNQPLLTELDTVLVDTRSHLDYGPHTPGVLTEVGNHTVQVVGEFTLGKSFAMDGLALTSDETFARIGGGHRLDRVSVGLIQLDHTLPVEQVAADLRNTLQQAEPDVRVLTRAEVQEYDRIHWIKSTSVGIIFSFGVLLAGIVGMVCVYQVIASDITNRLGEFATLKAIGYGPGFLARVVIHQSLLLAIFGYLPGLILAVGLYGLTRWGAGIPMAMTPPRAALVLAWVLAICGVSGLVASWKVFRADPAKLF
jgi:putative ABC transport system permease protein